jgi:hypothetical protein
MTDRANRTEGEDRQTQDLAPENRNPEQEDAAAQSQTLADEARGRAAGSFETVDSEKVSTGEDSDDAQDLVDHMNQMLSSGRIDNSAYRGEPNLDDDEDKYGPGANDDEMNEGRD